VSVRGVIRSRAAILVGLSIAASALAGVGAAPRTGTAGTVRVYVGTYTSGESKGIYRLQLDLATGALSVAGEPTAARNPSFLAFHPSGSFLYAVNEIGESRDDKGGAVSAFAVDSRTGSLTFLNERPSGGAAPCHISLDKPGRHVLVANYWGGSVAVLPLGPDGRLGPATALVQHEAGSGNTRSRGGPHAHSIDLDAADRFAVVADLGLDQLLVYRFDPAHGTIAPNQPPATRLAAGAGPRHFTFHPDGKHGYVINELDSTITAFTYDAGAGILTELQTVSTLPVGFAARNSTAELVVRADGRFLYGSNRGHDSIAIFALDAGTGRLTPLGHESTLGRTPRNFAIDPTGAYLLAANQDSDTVAVLRIDAGSGRLAPVGSPLHVPRPVCLRMVVASPE
jgi:6-phosphogluconolactonase